MATTCEQDRSAALYLVERMMVAERASMNGRAVLVAEAPEPNRQSDIELSTALLKLLIAPEALRAGD